jgi:putative transposase
MTQAVRNPLYRRHRFPTEVIAHAVWLYFRFPLSLRMVEDLLAARGITVSHQTVRFWAEKFGRHFANDIRRRAAGRLGDKWHLDEVVSPLAVKNTGSGGLSIRMASFSTCWCRAAAIPRPQNV